MTCSQTTQRQCRYPKYRGAPISEDSPIGIFHGFSIKTECHTGYVEHSPVAIVETYEGHEEWEQKGHVFTVSIRDIQFIDDERTDER